MRPLSATRPKPMLPAGDRPILAHTADAAVAAGADELVIVDRSFPIVRDAFGDAYQGTPVTYVDQGEATGTAGAVAAAAPELDDAFAVLNGDNLYDAASIERLFDQAPAVGVHEVADPRSYGVVSTRGSTVTGIVEKPDDPPTSLANTGAYVFPAEAAAWLDVPESERGEHELTDVLARTIDAVEVTVVEVDRWLDCGRPWEVLEANELVVGDATRDVQGDVHPSADLQGDVVVEAGATIEAGTVIEGPVLVRSGASVGPNAYVRGTTMIGPNASVGNAVEVKNSVLMDGATVPHLSYVGDSVLGRDVNLGAGTTVANLRHDDADVELTVKGERVSTGRRKFGVVLGDRAKTGIDTNLDAGVIMDVETVTRPGETVVRDRWQDDPVAVPEKIEPKPS